MWVLGLEPVEALVDSVEVSVDLVELGVHLTAQALDGGPDDPRDIRDEDLPMKLSEDLDQIFHVPDPTPPPAAMGPETN